MAKNSKMVEPVGADAQWQAEDDVRTLAKAHQIKQDAKRHGAAKAHARLMFQAAHGKAEKAEKVPDAEGMAEDKAEVRGKK